MAVQQAAYNAKSCTISACRSLHFVQRVLAPPSLAMQPENDVGISSARKKRKVGGADADSPTAPTRPAAVSSQLLGPGAFMESDEELARRLQQEFDVQGKFISTRRSTKSCELPSVQVNKTSSRLTPARIIFTVYITPCYLTRYILFRNRWIFWVFIGCSICLLHLIMPCCCLIPFYFLPVIVESI